MSYGAGSRQIRPLPNRQRTRKADNFNRVDSHHGIDEIINFVRYRQSTILESEPRELGLRKKAPLPRIGEVADSSGSFDGHTDENSNSSEGLNDQQSSAGSLDTDNDPAYESDPENQDVSERLMDNDGRRSRNAPIPSVRGARGARPGTPSPPVCGEILHLAQPHHHRTPSSSSSRSVNQHYSVVEDSRNQHCSVVEDSRTMVHLPDTRESQPIERNSRVPVAGPLPVPLPRRAAPEWSDDGSDDAYDDEEDEVLFSADGTYMSRPDAPSPCFTPPLQGELNSSQDDQPVDYIDIH